MTKIITENIDSVLSYRSRIFWLLIIGIAITAPFYAIFVHSAIVNVVEREKIVGQIREKSTAVSELESEYFAMKDKINMELAHSKGFHDTDVSSFIPRKSLTAFVSHNEL